MEAPEPCLIFFLLVVIDGESDDTADDAVASKETIDIRELKRIDHIINSLQRKVSYTMIVICEFLTKFPPKPPNIDYCDASMTFCAMV